MSCNHRRVQLRLEKDTLAEKLNSIIDQMNKTQEEIKCQGN